MRRVWNFAPNHQRLVAKVAHPPPAPSSPSFIRSRVCRVHPLPPFLPLFASKLQDRPTRIHGLASTRRASFSLPAPAASARSGTSWLPCVSPTPGMSRDRRGVGVHTRCAPHVRERCVCCVACLGMPGAETGLGIAGDSKCDSLAQPHPLCLPVHFNSTAQVQGGGGSRCNHQRDGSVHLG